MFKDFLNKIILSLVVVFATCSLGYTAQAPEFTIPNQYPQKYTPEYIRQITPTYKDVGKEEVFYVALDMLKDVDEGIFSRNAILGQNLSGKPVKIEFRDLGQINEKYASFDALGWKRNKSLYIYINNKHKDAPAGAIAALLAHEALHQDEFNSLAEETYAWTLEAIVWYNIVNLYPESNKIESSLVQRENTLKKLLEKGNFTPKYIKKAVLSNSGYENLPSFSPGFDSL